MTPIYVTMASTDYVGVERDTIRVFHSLALARAYAETLVDRPVDADDTQYDEGMVCVATSTAPPQLHSSYRRNAAHTK